MEKNIPSMSMDIIWQLEQNSGIWGGTGPLIFLPVKLPINPVIDNKSTVLPGNTGKRWHKGHTCVGAWT